MYSHGSGKICVMVAVGAGYCLFSFKFSHISGSDNAAAHCTLPLSISDIVSWQQPFSLRCCAMDVWFGGF